MPTRPKKICRVVGCGKSSNGSYCDEHENLKKVRPITYEKKRETAVRRGYDRRWQKLRRMKLQRNPICECDKCNGLPADLVHHVNGNSRDNRWSNLMSMNLSCHSKLHSRSEAKGGGGVQSLDLLACRPPASALR